MLNIASTQLLFRHRQRSSLIPPCSGRDGHTTLTIGADQAIGRLDRFNNLHTVMVGPSTLRQISTVLGRIARRHRRTPPPCSG